MNKSMIAFGISMMLTVNTAIAASGDSAKFVTYAKIVDIEEVWRTAKIKRYTDCRDVGSTTLCDTIEWVTINESVDFYRVTLNLGGKDFVIRQKNKPTGDKRKVSVKVTTYGK